MVDINPAKAVDQRVCRSPVHTSWSTVLNFLGQVTNKKQESSLGMSNDTDKSDFSIGAPSLSAGQATFFFFF